MNIHSIASEKTPNQKFKLDMSEVLQKAIDPDRRFKVTFEYRHIPHVFTVKATDESRAIDAAEILLWIEEGRPDLKFFAPRCISVLEVA